jgi:DNA-binding beta-propeller fold protein YncE
MGFAAAALSLLACACSGSTQDEVAHCDPEQPGICTIAGSGHNGYDKEADSTAMQALETSFSLPQDTLTSDDGKTVYILDWNNHRLRQLKDGKVSWLAGRGELGGSLDDPANNDFNHPTNIIFDETGEKLVMAAWHNSKIRLFDLQSREIEDSCGDGKRAYFGDDGPARTASLDLPASIAYANNGDLVIMDQANQVLRRVDSDGNIHLMAGQCIIDAPAPGGPGPCAEGQEPVACPPGPNGPSGKHTCGDPALFCSKPCTPGYSGDDIPATEMRMAQPFGQSAAPAGRIAYDAQGNLYFADTANHLIRMIDTDGIVHRVAGTPPENGVKQSGYSGDGGPALEAKLNFPVDLAFDDQGTLYFTDVYNHCVRSIDEDGIIRTAVGTCTEKGYAGDGGEPDQARLKLPFGLEWSHDRLLVSDTGNSVIRSVRFE